MSKVPPHGPVTWVGRVRAVMLQSRCTGRERGEHIHRLARLSAMARLHGGLLCDSDWEEYGGPRSIDKPLLQLMHVLYRSAWGQDRSCGIHPPHSARADQIGSWLYMSQDPISP
jgi:hypothetical protein